MILVVDDDDAIRKSIAGFLTDSGYRTSTAENGTVAMEVFRQESPDVVLLDLRMPDTDGFDVLRELGMHWDETPVIVISGTGVMADAIEAMKLGAWDFVTKPIADMTVLEHIVSRVLEKRRLLVENRRYREQLEQMVNEKTAQLEVELRARAEAERKFHEAQRLEAVGQLASGIAHDFNNVLTTIRGNAELALLEAGAYDDVDEMLSRITSACDRASSLTKRLLSYTRREGRQVSAVNLNDIVREVAGMLRPMLDRRIEIDMQLSEDAVTIQGDATELSSALLNLAVNARDAMPEGGTLGFATRSDGAGLTGNQIELLVSDTGVGMDAATRDRIFQPFFTTKQSGEGTGLGLAAVQACVQSHDGRIDVTTAPGEGTTFRITLPRSTATVASPRCEYRPVRPSTAGRVLVVDDEETIRHFAATVLKREGYDVELAADGVEAVDRLEEASEPFTVVLLDLNMPRAGGSDILDNIHEHNPHARVVLCSGYAVDRRAIPIAENVAGFLAKPFGIKELLAAISTVSGTNAPTGDASV
jgi:signal transduction histidine kinase